MILMFFCDFYFFFLSLILYFGNFTESIIVTQNYVEIDIVKNPLILYLPSIVMMNVIRKEGNFVLKN